MRTGYFTDSIYYTKVHVVDSFDKPICGTNIGPRKRFIWNASTIVLDYIECIYCKKKALKLLKRIV